ncbi:hypothetical protein D5086_000157 [Populus alba]|uniref:Uncharacterized protein n=2 Tax=Populus TaxID=3689 RepID=A0ACC4CV21_POPAL|nr:hypothetical protein NC653_000316 [Populus alba x Populus x berolinensis]
MAFGDGLSRFSSISIALIILTFVLMALVHSSRSLAAGNRARASEQDIHQSYKITRMGKGASSLVTDEESERQVPTGPDPLHHNNNPTTRP